MPLAQIDQTIPMYFNTQQIVKNTFVHGLVQEEKDAFGNEEEKDEE